VPTNLKVIQFFAVFSLGVSFAFAGALGVQERAQSLDEYAESQIKEQRLPGISIAVVKNGEIVKAKGYGMANLELSALATSESVYELASLTKQFTAVAILMLVNEKKLTLDDKLSIHLAEIPQAWRAITIRHLLTHTSGIANFTETSVILNDVGRNYTRAEMISLIARDPAKFRPGDDWAYNDSGYFLLGCVIEKASGKPYDVYVTERLLRPLGMAATRGYDPGDVIPNRAAGYIWHEGRFRRGQPVHASQSLGGGNLMSTVIDLSKWDAALDGETLLPRSLRDQLWSPARLTDGRAVTVSFPVEDLKDSTYGFGWVVGSMRGHRVIAHGGSIASGFSTYWARFPDDRLTVIVLTNRSQAEDTFGPGAPRPWEIARGIIGHYLPDLLKKERIKQDLN
jgi:D-alanyl-D-alanine carboxypeptidase